MAPPFALGILFPTTGLSRPLTETKTLHRIFAIYAADVRSVSG
jgi:hypothetical protein